MQKIRICVFTCSISNIFFNFRILINFSITSGHLVLYRKIINFLNSLIIINKPLKKLFPHLFIFPILNPYLKENPPNFTDIC